MRSGMISQLNLSTWVCTLYTSSSMMVVERFELKVDVSSSKKRG